MVRWIPFAPVVLAVAAAVVSAVVMKGPPHNVRLWLPAVISAVPLLVGLNPWPNLVATLWLILFVILGAATVGMFYVPCAVAMLASGVMVSREPARSLGAPGLEGAAKLSVWIAFGMTIVTSLAWLTVMLREPRISWVACTYLLLPALCASLPLWWRSPESTGAAAAFLAACAFFPLAVDMGIWYAPAFILMVYASKKARSPASR